MISDLKGLVRGDVIAPGEARYASVRGSLLFNLRTPDRAPAVIVRARDVRDVEVVVRYAHDNDLRVSPRGSGHNWSGIAMQDGVVLDLAGLADIDIEPSLRTADVGPAIDNRTMARRLAEHGLAFPLGHCGHVALSGYLLSGGLGWNSERWGLGCHNVTEIDVVTADGQLRRASETENPDLFWAARGGGPAFFGVVTRYRLALHTLPPAITTANRFYPLSRIRDVQDWMVAAKSYLPDNLEFTAIIASSPPHVATKADRVILATATVFADTEDEARDTLDRLGDLAPRNCLHSEEARQRFEDLYLPLDLSLPEGKRYAVDSVWSADPSDAFMETLAKWVTKAPSLQCMALAVVTPPRNGVAPPPDCAFSMSGPGFGLVYAVWDDPDADEEQIAWLRGSSDALAGEALGRYVGEADLARPGWLESCYSPEAWTRLADLRTTWDPRGVFRRMNLLPAEMPLAG